MCSSLGASKPARPPLLKCVCWIQNIYTDSFYSAPFRCVFGSIFPDNYVKIQIIPQTETCVRHLNNQPGAYHWPNLSQPPLQNKIWHGQTGSNLKADSYLALKPWGYILRVWLCQTGIMLHLFALCMQTLTELRHPSGVKQQQQQQQLVCNNLHCR